MNDIAEDANVGKPEPCFHRDAAYQEKLERFSRGGPCTECSSTTNWTGHLGSNGGTIDMRHEVTIEEHPMLLRKWWKSHVRQLLLCKQPGPVDGRWTPVRILFDILRRTHSRRSRSGS